MRCIFRPAGLPRRALHFSTGVHRYPLVTCERRRRNKDGEKDLEIDIVHRPQGDCYFDIQALSFHPADDTVVRNTLAEAIALLDVKAEIWDGDPFLRWQ